jgi:hypothetical protein
VIQTHLAEAIALGAIKKLSRKVFFQFIMNPEDSSKITLEFIQLRAQWRGWLSIRLSC